MSVEELNTTESYIEERNLRLRDIDRAVIQKAWFTLSHLLLDDSAKVVDIGCGNGAMTYTMAAMAPKVKFTGIDTSKRDIIKAREKYELHNLDFKTGDDITKIFEPESVDGIINSFVLHEIYSTSRYNQRIVNETLEEQFKVLKKGGLMFIRDYSRPPPEEYVLLELPDEPSTGGDLKNLSEADLLIWYSEHAQPRQDPGCGGFFLEELPTRFPKKRLFRLPFKWAYEFLMRKDDRAHWEQELPMEYTFFTPREFRTALRELGARVNYCGPHRDEDYIRKHFEGRMRWYSDDGTPLGDPPTSYIVVATKMAERKSLHIEERRPSRSEETALAIKAVRNEKTGELQDIVTPPENANEILPYRVSEEGRLKIYLHDGVARSISNAVARSGSLLDGRRWSGHMVEPITVDSEGIGTLEEFDVKHTVRFARDYLGLKPKNNAIIERGPYYYPAPDYIDERIQTYYLSVSRARGSIIPKNMPAYIGRFLAKGKIREFDAQQILDAIGVGLIPNARLELQILCLFRHLDIEAENWTAKDVKFRAGEIKNKTNLKSIMATYGTEQSRFKDVKGSAGQLRAVHSIFVEEGQSRGAMTGLTAEDIDFVIHEDQTINTAVVLPLTEGLKADVHAGFNLKQLPIPERHEGNGTTIVAPRFNLPPGITNLRMAKKFIAEKYGVLPEMVLKLGESYFTHIGMTPHRIYPFAVAVPPDKLDDPDTKFLPFYQFMLLRRSLARDPHFMIAIARAYRLFHEEIRLDFSRRVKAVLNKNFQDIQPEWSLPLTYQTAPTVSHQKEEEKMSREISAADKQKLNEKIQQKKQDQKDRVEEKRLKKETEAEEKAEAESAAKKALPPLSKEFEQELQEFMDVMRETKQYEPKPEKW